MLLIKNGLVHDAINREPYIADIFVKNGKIALIKKKTANMEKANLHIFDEADADSHTDTIDEKIKNGEIDVIDASGLNVYPGLVDAHSHLGLDGYAVGFEGQDYNE